MWEKSAQRGAKLEQKAGGHCWEMHRQIQGKDSVALIDIVSSSVLQAEKTVRPSRQHVLAIVHWWEGTPYPWPLQARSVEAIGAS